MNNCKYKLWGAQGEYGCAKEPQTGTAATRVAGLEAFEEQGGAILALRKSLMEAKAGKSAQPERFVDRNKANEKVSALHKLTNQLEAKLVR